MNISNVLPLSETHTRYIYVSHYRPMKPFNTLVLGSRPAKMVGNVVIGNGI